MSELSELYQAVILDHNKKPRNFHKLENANRKADGYNPLCGDQLSVYLHIDGDEVQDVSFEGSGCAISKASASMMTQAVKGKTKEEAEILFSHFHALVTGKSDEATRKALGRLEAFEGISRLPTRVKCASMPWHALRSAIRDSTEDGDGR